MATMPVAASAAPRGSRPQSSQTDARLKKVCEEFESVFTAKLLKSMRETVQSADFFGSEKDETTFRDMLDDETAKSIAHHQGMGIANMLYRQLDRSSKVGR